MEGRGLLVNRVRGERDEDVGVCWTTWSWRMGVLDCMRLECRTADVPLPLAELSWEMR